MKKFLCYIPLVLAFWAGLFSFFALRIPGGSELEATRVSFTLKNEMSKLDRIAGRLFYEPSDDMDWPEMKDFPENMVIYKYVDDTLHSWYNALCVNADISLSSIGDDPRFLNLGDDWFVMKSVTKGKVRLLEALNISSSSSSSSVSYISPNFYISPLCMEEGSTVMLDSIPLFKIVEKGEIFSSLSYKVSVYCRWLFLFFLALFAVLFLYTHRSILNLLITIVFLFAIAFASRMHAAHLVHFAEIFSPSIYTHDALINSYAVLLAFNLAMALSAICVFLCRKEIKALMKNHPKRKLPLVALVFALASFLSFYIIYTYLSVLQNSTIELELYKISSLSVYSLFTYLSYIILLVSLLVLIETALFIMKGSSMMGLQWLVLYSTLACAVLGFITSYFGIQKEYDRISAWGSKASLERNIELEKTIEQIVVALSANSRFSNLYFSPNDRNVLQRRIEEIIALDYDADLKIDMIEDEKTVKEMVKNAMSEGILISKESSVIFSHYGERPYYIAFIPYTGNRHKSSFLVLRVRQNNLTYQSLGISPDYSFARYKDSKKVSSVGSFPYSTDIRNIPLDTEHGQSTMILDHYRHFVIRIDEKNIVVVSRPEKTVATYLYYYVYLVLLLFITLVPFVRKEDVNNERQQLSWKIRTLVMSSLMLTMLMMMASTLYFVNKRNKRTQENLMVAKISSVQDELEKYCFRMKDYMTMTEPGLSRAIKNRIMKNTPDNISLYTPDGSYLALNEKYVFGLPERGRVATEAYKRIFFDYKRYCITKAPINSQYQYVLYAPVCNGDGKILAIASIPYKQDDYEFSMDVVRHSASMIGLFIIIFLVSITLSYSVTSSFFRPLKQISQKMKETEIGDMELLEYKGRDEISILVDAYNDMVVALRESNDRQLALERDKAWSEMARQVAHEIKNPLTPIKLEIQRLDLLRKRNDPKWDEKFSAASKIILEHIDILANAANDFSTFAKLYSQAPVKMDLDETIRNQIMLFSGKENLKIEYSGVKDAIISGPKPQLIRVVLNLLTNACQAVDNKENPVVKIMLAEISEKDNHYWKITFEDNGPGVSEENQHNLFVPNFTTKNSGTGLGLAICRNIVEKCGGSILYSRSETLGGACFAVELPDCLSKSGSNYSQI